MALNPSSKLFLWASTGVATEPTDAFKQAGWLVSTPSSRQRPPAQFSNWLQQQTNDWIEAILSMLFGCGDDGVLDFNGSSVPGVGAPSGGIYNLTRMILPTNMTVRAGYQVQCNGFPIVGNGLLTVESGGLIHANGNAATGQAAAAGAIAAMLGGGGAGGRGGDDGSLVGGVGPAAGASESPSLSGSGGAGGAGSSGGGGAGVASAPSNSSGGAFVLRRFPECLTTQLRGFPFGSLNFDLLRGGAGGGGGCGGNAGTGTNIDAGGGGGGGAGVLVVAFPKMNVLGVCFEAVGGAGGPAAVGGLGTATGGGGGGGGGTISLVCIENQNAGTALTANCSVAGGGGGAAARGGGVGSAGAPGTVSVYQP